MQLQQRIRGGNLCRKIFFDNLKSRHVVVRGLHPPAAARGLGRSHGIFFTYKILGHQFNKSELMVSRTMKLKENLSVGLEAICLGRKTIRSIFVSFGRMFFLTSFGKTTFFLWKQKSPSQSFCTWHILSRPTEHIFCPLFCAFVISGKYYQENFIQQVHRNQKEN